MSKKDRQTLEQIESIITLCDEKGMTQERMTRILATGILADVFDEKAYLWREDVRKALRLWSFIPLVCNVPISATKETKVAASFRGPNIVCRDAKLDSVLNHTIPATAEGKAQSFKFEWPMNFGRMVAEHIGKTGSHTELARALVEQEKYFSLEQVDSILSQCDKGNNPLKLRSDGWPNLFPVWDGASVFFVSASWDGGWGVDTVLGFDNSSKWNPGTVVVFRN